MLLKVECNLDSQNSIAGNLCSMSDSKVGRTEDILISIKKLYGRIISIGKM